MQQNRAQKHLFCMRIFLRTIIVLAALTAGTFASAQSQWRWYSNGEKFRTHKHENRTAYSVRFGWGGMPYLYANRFEDGIAIGKNHDFFFNPTIADAYQDTHGSTMSTGAFTGDFNWNAGRFMNLSATMALCPVWSDRIDGVTLKKNGNDFGLAISIMPNIRLMYCNTRNVRIYSSVGLGLGFYPGFKKCDAVCGEFQFNPVGVEVGRKWYGFGEIGVGTLYSGGRIGAGYQFGKIRRNHR